MAIRHLALTCALTAVEFIRSFDVARTYTGCSTTQTHLQDRSFASGVVGRVGKVRELLDAFSPSASLSRYSASTGVAHRV
jgi:hypothetical protein